MEQLCFEGLGPDRPRVQDHILSGPVPGPARRKAPRRREVTCSVVLSDHADCVFERRVRGGATTTLALLATRGQFYQARAGRAVPLDEGRLRSFVADDEDGVVGVPWVEGRLAGLSAWGRRNLLPIASDDLMRGLIVRDMVRLGAQRLSGWRGGWPGRAARGDLPRLTRAWRVIEPLVGHEACRRALSRALRVGDWPSGGPGDAEALAEPMWDLADTLGAHIPADGPEPALRLLSVTAAGVARLGADEALAACHGLSGAFRRWSSPLQTGELTVDEICAWLKALLRRDPAGLQCLNECILMQQHARWLAGRDGRVDLLPRDPARALRQASDDIGRARGERLAGSFEARAAELDGLSWSQGDYMVRPARSAAELVAEGERLHHCVGGERYIEKHAGGDTSILLMRRVDDPDTPLVTIEVRGGRLRQAFGSCNRRPDEDERAFIGAWGEEKGVGVASSYRPRAA